MRLDVKSIPFSRQGSYLAFSILDEAKGRPCGLYLRTVRTAAPRQHLLRIDEVDGTGSLPEISCDGSVLRARWGKSSVEVCFCNDRSVRIRGKGGPVLFKLPDPGLWEYAAPTREGLWRLNFAQRGCALSVQPLCGKIDVRSPVRMVYKWGKQHQFSPRVEIVAGPGDSKVFDLLISDITDDERPSEYPASFAQCVASARVDFEGWTSRLFGRGASVSRHGALSSYVLWSSFVGRSGNLIRQASFMSKNWMNGVWSWDHCFTAIALAKSHADRALDQLMIPFDAQRPDGCLPDKIDSQGSILGFCKPPIHGWAVARMLERGVPADEMSRQVYQPMCAWTRWWIDHRCAFDGGLPYYLHGNDSGWDNGTAFDKDLPLMAPDLSSYLILQCEVLSDLASGMGDGAQREFWDSTSRRLLEKMVEVLWTGDRFVGMNPVSGRIVASESLIFLMPLVLGKLLPQSIREALVAQLMDQDRFMSPWGPVSESLASSHFSENGYWRGAIWPPTVLLLTDGLRRGGYEREAREISKRFLSAIKKSGMSENFSPVDGKGLCDPAYSWTAAAYVLLSEFVDA